MKKIIALVTLLLAILGHNFANAKNQIQNFDQNNENIILAQNEDDEDSYYEEESDSDSEYEEESSE